MPRSPRAAVSAPPASPGVRLIAVIDVGATAIRMEIAAVDPNGVTRPVDTLMQPVNLGKDTFSTGLIQRKTTETCVAVMRQFRQVLDEYGIRDLAAVRAVATSAVREAENRDPFLDRIYMATQIPIECLEEVELSRLTYMAVRDLLWKMEEPKPWEKLVIEVGGGSTEVLLMHEGHVTFCETYRLGSLRLRETLETHRAAAGRVRGMLLQDIRRTIDQMRQGVPPGAVADMIAMSGDARFAAAQLVSGWDRATLGEISPRALVKLTERIMAASVDDLVRTYRLSYPEAETLGPALLTYCEMARAFEIRRIQVPKIHLRTALEIDMATRSIWSSDFSDQIRHAAYALADRFHADRRHGRHVADLSLRLFGFLAPEHRLGPRHALLLEMAAVLHELGLFLNNRSHHKHSQYLIMNSDLFGVTREDLLLISLIARYHRRSPPLPAHPYYATLTREQRVLVQKLASILRVADALDRNHAQRVREPLFEREGERLKITVPDVEDLTLERIALREKGGMFEDVYGLTIVLQKGHAFKGNESNV